MPELFHRTARESNRGVGDPIFSAVEKEKPAIFLEEGPPVSRLFASFDLVRLTACPSGRVSAVERGAMPTRLNELIPADVLSNKHNPCAASPGDWCKISSHQPYENLCSSNYGMNHELKRYADVEWTKDVIQMLGTRSDAEIATELGCSTGLVQQKRSQLGIPPYKG